MDNSIFRHVGLFSDLNDDEISKISSLSSKKVFMKGEMVFFETEPYLGFYIVADGSVKIFKISKEGRENIIHFIRPFSTFAEVPLFEQYEKIRDNDFTYPANAMAIENDTELVLVRSKPFYELLHSNKEICLKMLGAMSKKLRHMNNIFESRMKEIPQRLAEYILTEHTRKDVHNRNDLIIDISKHDLAAYLGTIDETLSRTFKKLQDEGIVDINGKCITIKNIERLKVLAKQ